MGRGKKQEGKRTDTDEKFRLPEVLVIAEHRKPHIFRAVYHGKKYIDITECFTRQEGSNV